MSDITAADLVGGADRNAATGLGAEGALLLDDDDDAVTCGVTKPGSDSMSKLGGIARMGEVRRRMHGGVIGNGEGAALTQVADGGCCVCSRTDLGRPLAAQHLDALDDGGAGVVDAVNERLHARRHRQRTR